MPGRFSSGAAYEDYETLDSTSLEAKRRAELGARGPLWIAARQQTLGYGRRGAAWSSSVGDFCASFLFDPSATADRVGEISFVAALAVIDVLGQLAPGADFRLKWPNDVLLRGAKVSGILLELIPGRDGEAPLLALGIGINVVTKPDNLDYPAARLVDVVARTPELSFLLEQIDARFAGRMSDWRSSGFAAIRRDWMARAVGVGELVRARLPDQTVVGVFKDLDSSGALVLDCEGVERRIVAGAILRA